MLRLILPVLHGARPDTRRGRLHAQGQEGEREGVATVLTMPPVVATENGSPGLEPFTDYVAT